MKQNLALSITDLSIHLGADGVLNQIHCQLPLGHIGCLLGPSGCGKTTLLRAIAGFEQPSSGEIHIAGQCVASASRQTPPEQRGIGMVFQDYALFPHLTVSENIAFGLHRLPPKERQKRTQDWLTRLHIDDLSQRLPHQLSGGQQQRVALARALAPQPHLVLFDEPFANLDAALRERLSLEVRDLLKSLGTSALLVTHDPQEAFALADHIGVMQAGNIIQWDNPYSIYHQPVNRFVANFVGLGSFLPAIQQTDGIIDSVFGRLHGQALGASTGDVIDMLIRPDDIQYDSQSELKVTVNYRAFRGPDTLYRLQCHTGQLINALFPSHIQLDLGQEIGIRLDTGGHVVAFSC